MTYGSDRLNLIQNEINPLKNSLLKIINNAVCNISLLTWPRIQVYHIFHDYIMIKNGASLSTGINMLFNDINVKYDNIVTKDIRGSLILNIDLNCIIAWGKVRSNQFIKITYLETFKVMIIINFKMVKWLPSFALEELFEHCWDLRCLLRDQISISKQCPITMHTFGVPVSLSPLHLFPLLHQLVIVTVWSVTSLKMSDMVHFDKKRIR